MSLSLSDAIQLLSKIKIVDNLFLKIGILLGLTFFLLYYAVHILLSITFRSMTYVDNMRIYKIK